MFVIIRDDRGLVKREAHKLTKKKKKNVVQRPCNIVGASFESDRHGYTVVVDSIVSLDITRENQRRQIYLHLYGIHTARIHLWLIVPFKIRIRWNRTEIENVS